MRGSGVPLARFSKCHPWPSRILTGSTADPLSQTLGMGQPSGSPASPLQALNARPGLVTTEFGPDEGCVLCALLQDKIPSHRCAPDIALMVRERATRMETEHETWCHGSRALQPLLDCGAESTLSPAFIPDCSYKNFFDLIFSRHYTDIAQISLFLPQAVPFRASLRTISKYTGSVHGLTPDPVFSWSMLS